MLALQERGRCPLLVFEFANRADVVISLVRMRSRLFPFFVRFGGYACCVLNMKSSFHEEFYNEFR